MSLLSTIMNSASDLVDFARRNIEERGMRIEKDGEDAVRLVDKDRGVVLAKFKSVDDMIESYGPKTPDLNFGNADNYIEAINPTGSKVEDMINLNMGDMYGMLPKGATKIKSEGGINYYKDGNDFYATTYNPDVGEEDVIGYHLAKDGASELQVVNEMKGRGIGSELSYQFRKNNPEAPSGGLSEAGERTARKTYDRLKAEGIVGGTAALGLLAASPESEAGAATQFIRLLEAGYPESTARKIMSGELPMDEASRMARAREQGFTTEAYHTGNPDILQFDPEKAVDDRVGTGTWFSENPAVASSYAEKDSATYRVLLNTDDFGKVELNTGSWSNVGPFEYVTKTGETFDSQLIDDPFITTTNELARFGRDQGDAGVIIEGLIDMGPNYKSMDRSLKGLEKITGQTPQEFYEDYDIYGRTNYSSQDPSNARSYYGAAFDPDNVGKPYIMGSPAAVGLLASEAVTPEGQLNPLLAVPAEIGSALNEAVVGTLDFIGPDTVNAISELLGTEYRMPRLSDQELVRLYTQGGYMDEGYGRDAIRTATGLLSPL